MPEQGEVRSRALALVAGAKRYRSRAKLICRLAGVVVGGAIAFGLLLPWIRHAEAVQDYAAAIMFVHLVLWGIFTATIGSMWRPLSKRRIEAAATRFRAEFPKSTGAYALALLVLESAKPKSAVVESLLELLKGEVFFAADATESGTPAPPPPAEVLAQVETLIGAADRHRRWLKTLRLFGNFVGGGFLLAVALFPFLGYPPMSTKQANVVALAAFTALVVFVMVGTYLIHLLGRHKIEAIAAEFRTRFPQAAEYGVARQVLIDWKTATGVEDQLLAALPPATTVETAEPLGDLKSAEPLATAAGTGEPPARDYIPLDPYTSGDEDLGRG
jgi:hypothetical protein